MGPGAGKHPMIMYPGLFSGGFRHSPIFLFHTRDSFEGSILQNNTTMMPEDIARVPGLPYSQWKVY